MSVTEDKWSGRPADPPAATLQPGPAAWKHRPHCWDQEWIRHPRIKRGIDLLAASVGLVLLAPLFAVIALSIRFTSPGPVFYRGLRTGRYARPFRIFKFRTMVQNAEQLGGTTTGAHDVRVTRIGHFLRRYKLDELPQLLNVIFGDISLVGPRPEVYEYTTQFNEREQVILAIQPGITDLSSLHFIDLQSHVGGVDPDEVFRTRILPVKNRLRVEYVFTQSIRGDLKILWLTALRLFIRSKQSQQSVTLPTVARVHEKKDLPHVALGRSQQKISRCGMGCWAAGGHGWGDVNDRQSVEAIRTAWDLGITHFDTADVYGLGHSESLLAEALGENRHRAVIATKFGVRVAENGTTRKDLSPRYCVQAIEESLRRLKLDTIPLLYAHWPDGKTPVSSLMETLLRLREQGKIQSIGLSNFSPADIREALRSGPVDAVQIQYSMIAPHDWFALSELVQEQAITVVTWGSLGRGLLTGKFTQDTTFPVNDSRSRDPNFTGARFLKNLQVAEALKSIAQKRGIAPGQVALRFVLDTPGIGCSLFGAKTPDQVRENVGALKWSLTGEEHASLRATIASTQEPAEGEPCAPGQAA